MHGPVFNIPLTDCFSDAVQLHIHDSSPDFYALRSCILCRKFLPCYGTESSIINTSPALALQQVQAAHFAVLQERYSSIACPNVLASFKQVPSLRIDGSAAERKFHSRITAEKCILQTNLLVRSINRWHSPLP